MSHCYSLLCMYAIHFMIIMHYQKFELVQFSTDIKFTDFTVTLKIFILKFFLYLNTFHRKNTIEPQKYNHSDPFQVAICETQDPQ